MEYISLDEEDFNCLVRGGVVKIGDRVSICLKDIGIDQMYKGIKSAELGIDIYKDHKKEWTMQFNKVMDAAATIFMVMLPFAVIGLATVVVSIIYLIKLTLA